MGNSEISRQKTLDATINAGITAIVGVGATYLEKNIVIFAIALGLLASVLFVHFALHRLPRPLRYSITALLISLGGVCYLTFGPSYFRTEVSITSLEEGQVERVKCKTHIAGRYSGCVIPEVRGIVTVWPSGIRHGYLLYELSFSTTGQCIHQQRFENIEPDGVWRVRLKFPDNITLTEGEQLTLTPVISTTKAKFLGGCRNATLEELGLSIIGRSKRLSVKISPITIAAYEI